jgi:hypothetical protein
VNVQLAVFAGVAVSAAVQVTVVTPIGNLLPEAGAQVTLATAQLSTAVANG